MPARSTVTAETPGMALRAFSTEAAQWLQFMPCMPMVFCMVCFLSMVAGRGIRKILTAAGVSVADCMMSAVADGRKKRRRNALATTVTELKLMAAAAIMGFRVMPVKG